MLLKSCHIDLLMRKPSINTLCFELIHYPRAKHGKSYSNLNSKQKQHLVERCDCFVPAWTIKSLSRTIKLVNIIYNIGSGKPLEPPDSKSMDFILSVIKTTNSPCKKKSLAIGFKLNIWDLEGSLEFEFEICKGYNPIWKQIRVYFNG